MNRRTFLSGLLGGAALVVSPNLIAEPRRTLWALGGLADSTWHRVTTPPIGLVTAIVTRPDGTTSMRVVVSGVTVLRADETVEQVLYWTEVSAQDRLLFGLGDLVSMPPQLVPLNLRLGNM